MPDNEQRLRVLEAGHRALIDQQAETSVSLRDLDARMERAISAGLRDVLADEELMDSLLDRLLQRIQRGAAERTGRWVFSGLKAIFSKWLVIGAIFLGVAQLLGWAPAKVVLGWLTNGKGP